jgi:VIT1/CCC1 family predicted Fe2+/Mn2+ transporter
MVSGSGALSALITLVVVGLICWLVWWFIAYIGLPEPFNKVVKVLVALFALVFLINFLLGLTGHPLIRW